MSAGLQRPSLVRLPPPKHLGSWLCRSIAQVEPKANGTTACRKGVSWGGGAMPDRTSQKRCPMLEPYEGKLSCTVLRGGGAGNSASLPDQRTAGAFWRSEFIGSPAPAAAELAR